MARKKKEKQLSQKRKKQHLGLHVSSELSFGDRDENLGNADGIIPRCKDSMGVDCSNMEMISGPKKKKEKQLSQLEQDKQVKLSKNMQRKLRRLQEEEEKKKLRVQVMETLQKHKLADDKFGLLHSSGTLGQEETMKEKLQRAMNYKRAGLPVPSGIPLFRERPGDQHIDQVLMEEEKSELLKGVASKISNKTSLANAQANEGVFNLSSTVASKGLKRKKR